MRIKTFVFFLMAAGTTTASAHDQVYAHTHETELLSRIADFLLAAPPWAYAITIVAVVALLRTLWKTS